MKAEQIVKWLPLLGVAAASQGAGWVESKCPLAPWRHRSGIDKNPSFGTKIMAGDSQVWCFSCQYGGTQMSLLYELDHHGHEFEMAAALRAVSVASDSDLIDDIEFDYEEARATTDVVPFPEWYIESFEEAWHVDPYHDENSQLENIHPYLALERDVTFEFTRDWDIRHDPWRNRICFPIRDYRGRLTGLHGRAISDKTEPRYLVYTHEGQSNPSVWLGEHKVDRELPVVFTESVFDLASVWEVYENVMTPLRAGINAAQLARVNWARTIITFFDGDEAGEMAAQRVIDGFRGTGTVIHSVWPPEGKDPADLTVREIAELLHPYLGEE